MLCNIQDDAEFYVVACCITALLFGIVYQRLTAEVFSLLIPQCSG